MKNLIVFLWKHRFFLTFMLLELISVLLIVSNNTYPRSKFISASNGFTSGILSAYTNASTYFNLKKVNEDLMAENAELRNKLKSSFIKLDTNSVLVDDTFYLQKYRYLPVTIEKNSYNQRNNVLIISLGKNQGLYPMMGVITSNGVVGLVKDVGDNYSTVISILHSKSAIDAKLKGSGNTGTIEWKGGSYRYGEMINVPAHAIVKVGDTIVTSGNSSIFPEGILIGIVTSARKNSSEGFYEIKLKFSVDYNKLEHAYAVFHLTKREQDALMENIDDE